MNTHYIIYASYSRLLNMSVIAMRTYNIHDEIVNECIQTFDHISDEQIGNVFLAQLEATYHEPEITITVYTPEYWLSEHNNTPKITIINPKNSNKLRQTAEIARYKSIEGEDKTQWAYDI